MGFETRDYQRNCAPEPKPSPPPRMCKRVLFIGFWDLEFVWNLVLVICNLFNISIDYTFCAQCCSVVPQLSLTAMGLWAAWGMAVMLRKFLIIHGILEQQRNGSGNTENSKYQISNNKQIPMFQIQNTKPC